ncbi:MAG: integration host factor subunit alpha [Pseudomonadota bacterium]
MMKKKDIIEAVHERLGFSKRETARLVESTLDIIKASLQEGEEVKISSFGKFSVREKKERLVKMPKTGVEITIPARKVVTFKLSCVLRDAINDAHRTRNSG